MIGSRQGLSLWLELCIQSPSRYLCAWLRGAARGRFVMTENWKEGKIFFRPPTGAWLPVVFLVAECKNSFFSPSFWAERFDSWFGGYWGPARLFVRPATEEHRRWGALLFFLARGPFNSRATEGLNIPACSACVREAGCYIVRGTVVVRKKAKNSSCNSRKLSQVVHQLVEQTESDILHVMSRL